ncbi:MAG: VCBS repeat-containing protein [Cyclobacteriaceae bacterium]
MRSNIAIVCLFLVCLFGCKEANEFKVFTLLDANEIGVSFQNKLVYTESENAYLFRSFYNGAGVALSDFNNDGNLDLFFCGNQEDNALYLGNGKFDFIDITEKAGVVSGGSWSTGVSVVDIDGNGWNDLYICKSGNPEDPNRRNELFLNQGLDSEGIPVFIESAKQLGLDNLGFSIHAVFLDYDKDGDLDLYLSNNSINPTDLVMDVKKGLRDRRDEGGGDRLLRNDIHTFTDVSQTAGIHSSSIGFGLGISVGDVNRDTWPDIYVANDFFEMDYLYLNNKDGTFTESISRSMTEISLGSMGVDIMDVNHDGFPEVFVTEMLPEAEDRLKTKVVFDNWDKYKLKLDNGYHRQFPRNSFQLNRGVVGKNMNVTFSEISRYADVDATDWSWGVQMVDFDNNGHHEIFVTNGVAKDLLDQDYIDFYSDPVRIRKTLNEKGAVIKEMIDQIPVQPIPNYLFVREQNWHYKNRSSDWGLDTPGFSSGSAYGDIDNDGDLDLVVSNINQFPFIYRNNSKDSSNHFINLRLITSKGTTAIGSQVTLFATKKRFFQELYPIRGAMSTCDDRLHFGLGTHDKIDSLIIIWPNGRKQVEYDVKVDQFVTYQNISRSRLTDQKKEYFEQIGHPKLLRPALDISQVYFKHSENNFVDFDRDHLLFHMSSNEGPKIAVADFNGDGKDDFYVGGALNQSGVLFKQGSRAFDASSTQTLSERKRSEDQAVLFFDADNDGDKDLIVTSGGPEFSGQSYALVDRLYIYNNGQFEESDQSLPINRPLSTSTVENVDFDNDGDEDLFFGIRLLQESYGLPASSYLLENDGQGNFNDVTQTIAPGLVDLGMVRGAQWLDIENDGDQDLVIVGDWMSIKFFVNEKGRFSHDPDLIMPLFGFWNCIEKADLDNDGDDDLIVGNHGMNSNFKATTLKPVKMYINDFDQNGDIEHIITVYNGENDYPIVLKKELTKQIPSLLKKYLRHSDYSGQKIQDIFSKEQLENSLVLKATETKSLILWNEGDEFTPSELPFESQLFPIYAIESIDLNNDGFLDLVVGGNQFRAKPQTGIYAAGFGQILMNKKDRNFRVIPANESGLLLSGEIRDIELIKIDGKEHLLFAQSNDDLVLYTVNDN